MNKSKLLVFAYVLIATVGAFAQVNSKDSFASGVYYSPAYNYGVTTPPLRVAIGAASGAATITLSSGSITLPDGRSMVPLSTATPITIGAGSNSETVTPTTVSGCVVNGPPNSCLVTATFTNAHGQGDIVQSGTAGYQEALLDAANNGGGMVYFFNDSGTFALATGGTTTDTTANMLPANSFIQGVTGRVQTAISGGTCTAWGIGDPTTATRFTPTTIALTAGIQSTSVLPAFLGSAIASATTGAQQGLSAAKVRITCATGAPGAGAVRVRVWGYTFVAPNN